MISKIHKSNQVDIETASRKNLVKRIANIWKRARHNAFAHKVAARDSQVHATVFFIVEILFSFLSILFIIVTYLCTASPPPFLAECVNVNDFTFFTTIISVVCTLVALLVSILASYLKFDIKHAEHLTQLGSYQHIAQKARMAKWDEIPYAWLEREFLWMEESFQLLKARGREPSDRQFIKGGTIFDKISADPKTNEIQSFPEEKDENIKNKYATSHRKKFSLRSNTKNNFSKLRVKS